MCMYIFMYVFEFEFVSVECTYMSVYVNVLVCASIEKLIDRALTPHWFIISQAASLRINIVSRCKERETHPCWE